MRSDGRFFVFVDTLTGEFKRGDTLLVPSSEKTQIEINIERIYFVGEGSGSQQSIVFKDLEPEMVETIERAVGEGCVMTIRRTE